MTTDQSTPPSHDDSGAGGGTFFFLGFVGGFIAVVGVAFIILILAIDPEFTAQAAESNEARTPTTAATDDVAMGLRIAESNGCVACHSSDGTVLVGPSWLGVHGAERTLDDGTVVVADSAYLTESITDPPVKVVMGFAGNVMPTTYVDSLSATEINQLVAYIESLGS